MIARSRIAATLLAASLLVGSLGGAATATATDEGDAQVDFWLTVLHNNDGESALLPDGDQAGVALFASVVRREKGRAIHMRRPGNRGVVFVSSGDNFLASPSFTASVEDGVWYDARALDLLGYDAIALGNHDFDFGPDTLAGFISDGYRQPGRPPYVSSNLDFSGEPALQALFDGGVIAESVVVRERGERIGIIGATTPSLPFISSPRDVIVLQDVAAEVQTEVDELTAQGVDKIILISHLQDVDEDINLAAEITGIDVMVAGGGDELLANPGDLLLPTDDEDDISGPYPIFATDADGNMIPVVTTSGQYGYLGRLVVGFDQYGNIVEIDEDRSGPVRVVDRASYADGVPANRRIQKEVVDPVEDFVAELAANVIATSEVDLDGERNTVRFQESNQGNLMADSLRWQASVLADEFGVPVPDVALQNGGGIRNDSVIPAGDITELDTFGMAPFPNFVTVFPAISRETFKDILENAVSRIDPPAAEGGTGRFAQVSGFSVTFDTTGTPMQIDVDGTVLAEGTRVQEVVLDDGTVIVSGGAVVPGDDLVVATIDFLARGGDQYPYGDAAFTLLGVSYQQALANYLQAPTADGGLGGVITAADYPEGGEGRITQLP